MLQNRLNNCALAGVAQWGVIPQSERVQVPPGWGAIGEAPNACFSLTSMFYS